MSQLLETPWQLELPATEYGVLDGHVVHDDEFDKEDVFAGHELQDTEPNVANVPAGQTMQEEPSSDEMLPAGQLHADGGD